jgi:hypothetical protein
MMMIEVLMHHPEKGRQILSDLVNHNAFALSNIRLSMLAYI